MSVAATAAASPAGQRHAASSYDAWKAYLFLAPFLLIYLVFLVYPLFKGFWISLHDGELVGDYRQYISGTIRCSGGRRATPSSS